MPVGNAESGDALGQLLESGVITDATPMEEVMRLVAEAEAGTLGKTETSTTETPTAAAGITEETEESLAAPSIAALKSEAPVDKQQGTPTAAPAAAAEEEAAPIATPSGRTIDYGVLKSTRAARDQYRTQAEEAAKALEELREQNRKQQEEIARLQSSGTASTTQVQQAANAAGVTDARGRPVDVETVDIDSLRDKFPAEIVDIIAAQQATIARLAKNDAARSNKEALTADEQLQADIDAVPALAKWHADADKDPSMWNAAVAVRQTLARDPVWKDKPQLEVFNEVARRLGGQVSQPTQQQTNSGTSPGAKAAEALAAAQKRAMPHTHSDLPAGSPVAQSELEGLAGLDVTQIAEKMANMTPAQEEEFIRRYAS